MVQGNLQTTNSGDHPPPNVNTRWCCHSSSDSSYKKKECSERSRILEGDAEGCKEG